MNPIPIASATLAAPAAHAGNGLLVVVLLVLATVLYAAGHALSVRLHPWRPCRRCGESGKHRGSVFNRSFRPCSRCGGTGRELRRFARLP